MTHRSTEESSDSNENPGFDMQKVISLLSIIVLLGIQAYVCWQNLSYPFVNGQEHFSNNSARYLLLAIHSNDDQTADARKFFGTAKYQYDESNRPQSVSFYAAHGLLKPTVTRITVSLLGPHEWVIRVLCLSFSMACTILLYCLLRTSLVDPVLVFGATLLYVLLPLKFLFVDVWKFESSAELMMLACLFAASQAANSKFARYGYWAAMALAFHSDYPAFLLVGGILLAFLFTRKRDKHWALFVEGVIASSVGVVSTGFIQWWLGFGDEIIAKLKIRTSGQIEHLSWTEQFHQQWEMLLDNLGWYPILALLIGVAYVAAQPRLWKNVAALSGLSFFFINLAWCIIFRNHVHIHGFAQWFFIPATALLVGSMLQDIQNWLRISGWPIGQILGYTLLLFVMLAAGLQAIAFRNNAVTLPYEIVDMRTIESIDAKLRIVPHSGDRTYWTNRATELYIDPIYRSSRNVGVQLVSEEEPIEPSSGVFPVINDPQVLRAFIAYLSTRTGSIEFRSDDLVVVAKSPQFVFVRWNPSGNP